MDFIIIATLVAVLLGFLYFLYGEKQPIATAFTEDELEKLDSKSNKKSKAKKANKPAKKAPAPAPAPAPVKVEEEPEEPAAAPKPKKKKSKKKAAENKPAENKPEPKRATKKAKAPKPVAPPRIEHHDSSEYDGEWSTVTSKERHSPKKSEIIAEAVETKVIDKGTEIDLGKYKAAVIGKGGEVVKRLTAETGARFNIGKEDSMCTITGPPQAQQAGVAAVQAILHAEDEYVRTNSYTDTIDVGSKVGAVVGKGGSTIKGIQAQCGNVKLSIVSDEETGMSTVHIKGEKSMVEKAKMMVVVIVSGGLMPGEITTEVDLGSLQAKLAFKGAQGANIRKFQQDFGAKLDLPHGESYVLKISGQEANVHAALGAVREFLDKNCRKEVMDITRHVGAIIGKRGATIKRLQETIGARMDVVEDSMGGQDLEIFGTALQVKNAIDAVEQIKRDADDPRPRTGPGEILAELTVPEKCVGSIIGRAGAKISQLQEDTGAKIKIPRNTCTCYIVGSPEAVEACNGKINAIIEEQELFDKRREEREAAALAAAEAAEAEAREEGEVDED